jgi:hypothetical protein
VYHHSITQNLLWKVKTNTKAKVITTLQLKHKVMLLVNALLGLLYVVSSYWIWAEVEKWFKWNIASNWTPFLSTHTAILICPNFK